MTAAAVLTLLLMLFTKHLVIDFPLQGPYQYKNKGTYGHPGGILHSGMHGAGTFFVLLFFVDPLLAFVLGIVDFVVHYHVDWAKMNLNKKLGLGPTTHEEFWWLLGVDQFLHTATYLAIVAICI